MIDGKAAWRSRTRDWAIRELGGRCIECGVTDNLQFDHIDAASKVIEISVAIRDGWSLQRIAQELQKCQLLCIAHHAEKSRRLGEHVGGHNKIVDPPHGTAKMYGLLQCRCEQCRQWKSLYRHRLVDSRGNTCDSGSVG